MRAVLLLCFLTSSCFAAPYFVTYIDKITSWWPPEAIAAAMGVPTYAQNSSYNVINLSFWTTGGPVDAATVWANLITYIGTPNPWNANTTQQAQQAWLALYHAAGIKLFISCFGATNMPTGQNPTTVGQNVAAFVKTNQLDGVDVDYEDNDAMNSGAAVSWLVTFTNTLKANLPSNVLISHAPQAPWFSAANYPGGCYLNINSQCGSAINFYNIQYYNQGTSDYTTYNTLFVTADGWATNTAVYQVVKNGVPASKMVVGKPVTSGDATNTGYVPLSTLNQIIQQALSNGNWTAGIMGWQYSSDMSTGDTWINTLAKNNW